MEPITFGVITGVLESILMGQQVDAEEKKAAKQADQERKAGALGDAFTWFSNKDNARVVFEAMNTEGGTTLTPFLQSVMIQLEPPQQAAIIGNAMRDLPPTTAEKGMFDAANVDAATARTAMTAPGFGDLPQWMRFSLGVKAASGFAPNEISVINGLPDEPQARFDQAQELLPLYGESTPLGLYLRNVAKPGLGYTPVKNEDFNQLRDTIFRTVGEGEDKRTVAVPGMLPVIDRMLDSISPFVYGPDPDDGTFVPDGQAVQDHILLEGLRRQYASMTGGEMDDPAFDVGTWLDNSRNELNQLDDKSARITAARSVIQQFQDEDFKVENLDQEAETDYLQIVSMAEMSDEVDANRYVYISNNNAMDIATGQRIDENPDAYLSAVNKQLEMNPGFYQSMSDEQKFEFRNDISYALRLDANYRESGKQIQNEQGVTGKYGEVIRYHDAFKNVYALPFVPKLLHEQMNIPEPGTTRTGAPTLPAQTVTDSQAMLPTNQLRIAPNRVISLSPDAQVFAQARGYTSTHQMFTTNDLYVDMLDTNNGANASYLFTPAMRVMESGIFLNKTDKPVTTKSLVTLGQIYAANAVNDRTSQMLVISANMDPTLPMAFKPKNYEAGISATKFNAFLQQALGRPISLDDIGTQQTNATNFLATANQAKQKLMGLGDGSQISRDVAASVLNLFLVEASVFDQAVAGGKQIIREAGLLQESDFGERDGVSAAAHMRAVEDTADRFLKSSFLSDNATLKQALVTLAYNFAKTMDPSGRISERDFSAALEAVSAGATATKETQVAVINNLIQMAEDNQLYYGGVFDISSSVQAGDRYYELAPSDVQRIRGLRYFDAVKNMTLGMDRVDMYRANLSSMGGFNSRQFRDVYTIIPASDTFGSRVARNQKIFRVKQKSFMGGEATDLMQGVPLFVDAEGNILSSARIRELKAMQGQV